MIDYCRYSGRSAVSTANLRLKRPSSCAQLLVRVGVWDVAWGAFSPFAAYLLRDWTLPATTNRFEGVAAYCGISLLCSLFIFQWFQTSAPISRFFSVSDALNLAKACTLIAALSAALAFVFSRLDEVPRSLPVLHFLLLTSGLLGARMVLRLHEMRGEARSSRVANPVQHVLLIGATRLAWFFSKMVEELAPGRYQIIAILDERPEMQRRSLNGYPIVGSPAHLDRVLDEYALHGITIDKVILAAPPGNLSNSVWQDVSRLVQSCHIGLEILSERLIPEEFAGCDLAIGARRSTGAAPAARESLEQILDRPFWNVKRVIDFAFALTASVLLAPVALAVLVVVLLDVGIPVIFWQRRVGRNGAPLHVYKFRTLAPLFDRRTMQRREAQTPSLTGRFLRTTRLDELPQLWNILSGEMSLIGPRPLLPIDQPKNCSRRLTVRPGLTGWAQVCGGNLVSTEEKNALDEWYIRHASLKLDVIILARTIWMFLAGETRDEKAISMAALESALDGPALSPASAPAEPFAAPNDLMAPVPSISP